MFKVYQNTSFTLSAFIISLKALVFLLSYNETMQNKTSSASRLALFPPSLLPSSCDNIPYLFFKGGKENQTEVVSL